MLALIVMLVFLAGYATQRGSVCAVSATRELIVERKPSRYVGILFCAACGLVVMAIAVVCGQPVFDTYTGLPVNIAAVTGGAIVGLGAYLNGRCAFGTIAELGGGVLSRLATLVGFIAGTALGDTANMSLPDRGPVPSPLAALPASTTLVAAAVVMVVLGIALLRLARPHPPPEWSPLRAMLVIGVGNGVLLVLAQSWPYTSLLMQIARGGHGDLARGAIMAVVFVLGAVAGGMVRGFALRIGSRRDWLRALAGGTVMGIGAVLVPGGNDAMLLVGIPLLLPSFIAAFVAMSAVLIVLVVIRARRKPDQGT